MYPNFEFALEQLTGADVPDFLSIFQVFGLFVAFAFLAAAWALTSELKRKEQLGLLQPTLGNEKDKKTGETKLNTALAKMIDNVQMGKYADGFEKFKTEMKTSSHIS